MAIRRRSKKGRHNRRAQHPERIPAASLTSRASRTLAGVSAEPNYYLDLADIALGRRSDAPGNGKAKDKP
jgi:hypothetical protein